jgi:hypothetical protein
MPASWTTACVIPGVLTMALATAAADDFRVATKVYSHVDASVAFENLTLFADGVVYDFMLTAPREVVVFDGKRGRFILLDAARKVQTGILGDELLKFAAAIQARGRQSSDAFVRFVAEPKFSPAFDAVERRFSLSSDYLTYQVKTVKPTGAAAAREYRHFADWYAYLNATNVGAMPPFPRMELNKALADQGLVPAEVELTIVPDPRRASKKKIVVRSEHEAAWRLLPTDRERIDKLGADIAQFRTVSFEEFRRRPAPGDESR